MYKKHFTLQKQPVLRHERNLLHKVKVYILRDFIQQRIYIPERCISSLQIYGEKLQCSLKSVIALIFCSCQTFIKLHDKCKYCTIKHGYFRRRRMSTCREIISKT